MNTARALARVPSGRRTKWLVLIFWLIVVAFNLVGLFDLILDYYHAIQFGLPALAGQLGATYAIPVVYVPMLMITHVVAFYWLLRPQPKADQALAGGPIE